jgi:hypothetical protein
LYTAERGTSGDRDRASIRTNAVSRGLDELPEVSERHPGMDDAVGIVHTQEVP